MSMQTVSVQVVNSESRGARWRRAAARTLVAMATFASATNCTSQQTQGDSPAYLVIETLEGTHELTIPAGTQPGQLFRLKGAGVHALRGRGRGDLLVRVEVEVPTKLDDDEAELLHRLADLRGEAVAEPSKGVFARLRSAFQ